MKHGFWAAGLLTIAATANAYAEPGGTSGVSGVAVTQGAIKLEARSAVFDGGAVDGNWLHRAQASYGVTDWWRAQLNIRASQPDGESAELRSIGLENAVEFTATNDWPVQFGGQVEYKFGLNGAEDVLEFKLLAERRAGAFAGRFNLIAEREVGSDSDEWEHGYAARVMWRANEVFQFGVEGFGELDEDAHAWGPRAGLTLGQTTFSLGYLVGLGDAEANTQVRLSLEWAR